MSTYVLYYGCVLFKSSLSVRLSTGFFSPCKQYAGTTGQVSPDCIPEAIGPNMGPDGPLGGRYWYPSFSEPPFNVPSYPGI